MQYPQEIICGRVHSYCNANLKTFKLKTVCSDMDSTVVFLHSQCGWCFEIVFWMIWVLRPHLYLTFIRKKCDNLMSKVMWFRRSASVLKQPLCGFNNWVALAVRWSTKCFFAPTFSIFRNSCGEEDREKPANAKRFSSKRNNLLKGNADKSHFPVRSNNSKYQRINNKTVTKKTISASHLEAKLLCLTWISHNC